MQLYKAVMIQFVQEYWVLRMLNLPTNVFQLCSFAKEKNLEDLRRGSVNMLSMGGSRPNGSMSKTSKLKSLGSSSTSGGNVNKIAHKADPLTKITPKSYVKTKLGFQRFARHLNLEFAIGLLLSLSLSLSLSLCRDQKHA